jgi:general secretion pathway protein L
MTDIGLVARRGTRAPYEWARVSRGAATSETVESGTADDLARAADGASICVLLNGSDVRATRASIPARSLRLAQQAAPFAIEDDTAEDVEGLEVVCSEAQADGTRTVLAARRDAVEALIGPLRRAGVRLERLLPDYLALPWESGTWTVLQDEDAVLARTGPHGGFRVERELFVPIARRLVAEGPPAGIQCYGETPLPAGIDVTAHPMPVHALTLLAVHASRGHGLDLLPPEARTRNGASRRGLLVAVALVGAAVVAHVAFTWYAERALAREVSRLRTAQEELVRRAFPDLTRIVNAQVQAEQAVAQLRTARGPQTSFLDALYVIGRPLAADGAQPAPSLEGINYADGVFNLRVRAPDIAMIEHYAAALAPELSAEVASVESQASAVVGNLRVQSPVTSAAR